MVSDDIYNHGVVFVSSAYTHADPKIVLKRKQIAGKVCAKLISKGVNAISPIVYGCALMEYGYVKDNSWERWEKFCKDMLMLSKVMYIIDFPGWKKSKGVEGEIALANLVKTPVYLINPKTLKLTRFKRNI